MSFKNLWKNLPPEIQKIFSQEAAHKEYKRGDSIYRAGDAPKGIYFIESGLVGLVITGQSSGKEHLLRFFKEGQFFGHRALFSDEGYHATTTALQATSISLIPRDVVIKVLEKHPVLYRDVVLTLAKELRHCEEQRVMILENQILSRTAQALIYLKDLHPEHAWTRQEIANFCASTVSTIIKALAELEDLGFIRQEGRAIEILDRDGLLNITSGSF